MKILKFYNSQTSKHDYVHLDTTFDCLKYKIYFPIEEIDISSNSSAIAQFNVTVNPTVILIDEDSEVGRISGLFSVNDLVQLLKV